MFGLIKIGSVEAPRFTGAGRKPGTQKAHVIKAVDRNDLVRKPSKAITVLGT